MTQPNLWDDIENNSFTLSETLSVSFLSSASTLGLVNLLAYLLIFSSKSKNTSLSRVIISVLVTWWLGSTIDYVIDLISASDSPERIRFHRLIEACVVRLFYITSTELFNWSLFTLFCTLSDEFRASLTSRRYVLPPSNSRMMKGIIIFQGVFALSTYTLGFYESLTARLPLFHILFIIYFILSLVTSSYLIITFAYTHYLPSLKSRWRSTEDSLSWSFSSGLIYLGFGSIVHIFFSLATIISGQSLYDVRISVLSCSIRYSLFLLFLWRVRRNTIPVFELEGGAVVRRRGSSTLIGSSAKPDFLGELWDAQQSFENHNSTF